MNAASTNLVKQLIRPENRLNLYFRSDLPPPRAKTTESKLEWQIISLTQVPNLICFLRKRRKWKMLSDTKRMLFSPLRSLLRLLLYVISIHLALANYGLNFHDGFWQRMVQTGKQLTISGWKNNQHSPSIYLHHLLFSPKSMNEIFRPVCEITFS